MHLCFRSSAPAFRHHASMGPRSDNRGYVCLGPRLRRSVIGLQWVHGPITVVMAADPVRAFPSVWSTSPARAVYGPHKMQQKCQQFENCHDCRNIARTFRKQWLPFAFLVGRERWRRRRTRLGSVPVAALGQTYIQAQQVDGMRAGGTGTSAALTAARGSGGREALLEGLVRFSIF